jgi:superfamily II DNA or RNA helicase
MTGSSVERIDNRLLLNPISFPKKPQLRDYQAPAVPLAREWQQGCVIKPCGAGKTVTAMGIIAELEQPTLWITHTMDLLNQSMNAAINFLGLTGDQIGLIQGQNMKIGSHITFATVQTLAKRDLSEIREKFGCVVVDESHLCYKSADKARQFESVISQFPAYYRFGMTASEHRADGLIETMFHVIGPKFYEVAQDDPRLSVMTPRVEFIETDFYYEPPEDEMLNVQQMYQAMREDEARNFLVGQVLTRKILPDDCCLVLGDSLEQLEQFKEYLVDCGRDAAFICGTTPKREREKIMAGMRAGKYQFLFATYALAKLGLDIPRLSRLVLITPHRDKTTIQQAVGRIMRPFEGKSQPVVYDIYDSKVKQLVYWARERKRQYLRLKCQVDGGPVVRKW